MSFRAIGFAALASLLLTAQTSAPAQAHQNSYYNNHHGSVNTPVINDRISNQRRRIRRGRRSGDLTRHQTRRLRGHLADIRHAKYRFARDGRISRFERFRLRRMLKRNSRRIARAVQSSRYRRYSLY